MMEISQDDKRKRLLLQQQDEESGVGNNNNRILLEEDPMSSREWPTVYDEARDMLLSAVVIYGVVDLRTLARTITTTTKASQQEQQQYPKDNFWMEKLLSLPVSAKDVVRLLALHRHDIERDIGQQSTELYLGAFDAIHQSTSSSTSELELEFCNGQVSLVSFDVAVVEDEMQDQELVYAICVDTARRRITVLFRGCSTNMDWSVCATNFLKHRDNPLYQFFAADDIQKKNQPCPQQQPETIAIHQGYCDYLFRVNSKTGRCKFDSIVRHVQSLLQQHPGYQVYVTGHSLGAALATVFAFYAAATQKFGLITCINFASPMVGNLAFETAFRSLELQGRIRCLRVTNHFDIFTQLPDRGNWLYVFACCWGFHLVTYVGWTLLFFLCFSSHVYRHVGMDLHMYRRRRSCFSRDEICTYKIKHPRGTPDSFVWRVAHDWKKHFKQTVQRLLAVPFVVNLNTNHSVQEHLWRLTQLSSDLEGLYLKDLYDTQRFPEEKSPTARDALSVSCETCPVLEL